MGVPEHDDMLIALFPQHLPKRTLKRTLRTGHSTEKPTQSGEELL